MSDVEKNAKNRSDEEVHDPITDDVETPEQSSTEVGLHARLRKFLIALQQRPLAKADLTKDRTRSLLMLIGASVAAVLLFLGVLSTPARLSHQERTTRTAPNLGRPVPASQSATVQGSVTPLLNADVQSNGVNSDQLSAADIGGTSRRSSESEDVSSRAEAASANRASARIPRTQPGKPAPMNVVAVDRPDPLAAYRLNTGIGAPTYSYGSSPGLSTSMEP